MSNERNALSENAILVKRGEVVFPDAIVQLPFFTAAKNKTNEVIEVRIAEMGGFTDIYIKGKQLNIGFDKKAYSHTLSKAQSKNSTTVTIDIPEMLKEFGYRDNDTSHYVKLYAQLMDDLYKMEISYTSPSGVRFHGRLINEFSEPVDGISVVDFGGFFQQLMFSHQYFSRLNYLEDRIKGGVASVLKEKLDIEYRKLCGTSNKTIEVKVEYLFQSLQLGGTRENQLKTLNVALDYFVKCKYITNIKKVTRSQKLFAFKITFNPNFKMEDLDAVIVKGKIATAVASQPAKEILPATSIKSISPGVDLLEPEWKSDEEFTAEFDSLFNSEKLIAKDIQSSSPVKAVDVKNADEWDAVCDFNDWVDESNKGK